MIAILLFASVTVSSIARPIPKILNCTDVDIEEINSLVKNLNLDSNENDIFTKKEWEKLKNLERNLPEGKLKDGLYRSLRLIAAAMLQYAGEEEASIAQHGNERSMDGVILDPTENRIPSNTADTGDWHDNIISDSSEHKFYLLNGLKHVIPHQTPDYLKNIEQINERTGHKTTEFPEDVKEITFEMQPSSIMEYSTKEHSINKLYTNNEPTLKSVQNHSQPSEAIFLENTSKDIEKTRSFVTKTDQTLVNDNYSYKSNINESYANTNDTDNSDIEPLSGEITNLIYYDDPIISKDVSSDLISVSTIPAETINISKTDELDPTEQNLQTTFNNNLLKGVEGSITDWENNVTQVKTNQLDNSHLLLTEENAFTKPYLEVSHELGAKGSDTVDSKSTNIIMLESTAITLNEVNDSDILSSTDIPTSDESNTTPSLLITKETFEANNEIINLKSENNFLKYLQSSKFSYLTEPTTQNIYTYFTNSDDHITSDTNLKTDNNLLNYSTERQTPDNKIKVTYTTDSTVFNINDQNERAFFSQSTLATSPFEFNDVNSSKFDIETTLRSEILTHHNIDDIAIFTYSPPLTTTENLYNISNDVNRTLQYLENTFDSTQKNYASTSSELEIMEASSFLNDVTLSIISNASSDIMESVPHSSGKGVENTLFVSTEKSDISHSHFNENKIPIESTSNKIISGILPALLKYGQTDAMGGTDIVESTVSENLLHLKSNFGSSTPSYLARDILINNNDKPLANDQEKIINTKGIGFTSQSENDDEHMNTKMTETVNTESVTRESFKSYNVQTQRNFLQDKTSNWNQPETTDGQTTDRTDGFSFNDQDKHNLDEFQIKGQDYLKSGDSYITSYEGTTGLENTSVMGINHYSTSSPTLEVNFFNPLKKFNDENSGDIYANSITTINVMENNSYSTSALNSNITDIDMGKSEDVLEKDTRFEIDTTGEHTSNHVKTEKVIMDTEVSSEQQTSTTDMIYRTTTGILRDTTVVYIQDKFHNDNNISSVYEEHYDEQPHQPFQEEEIKNESEIVKSTVTTTESPDRNVVVTDYKNPQDEYLTTYVQMDHKPLLTTETERLSTESFYTADSEQDTATHNLEELVPIKIKEYDYRLQKTETTLSEENNSKFILTTPFSKQETKVQSSNDEEKDNAASRYYYYDTTINPNEHSFFSTTSLSSTLPSISESDNIMSHKPKENTVPNINPKEPVFSSVTSSPTPTKFQLSEREENMNITSTVKSLNGVYHNYDTTRDPKEPTFLPITSSSSLSEGGITEGQRLTEQLSNIMQKTHKSPFEHSKSTTQSEFHGTDYSHPTKSKNLFLGGTGHSQVGLTTSPEWNTVTTSNRNIDPIEYTQTVDDGKINALNMKRGTTTAIDEWFLKGTSEILSPAHTAVHTDDPAVPGAKSTPQIYGASSDGNRQQNANIPFNQTTITPYLITYPTKPIKILKGFDSVESSYKMYFAPATRHYSQNRRHIEEKYKRRIGNCARIRNNVYKSRNCK